MRREPRKKLEAAVTGPGLQRPRSTILAFLALVFQVVALAADSRPAAIEPVALRALASAAAPADPEPPSLHFEPARPAARSPSDRERWWRGFGPLRSGLEGGRRSLEREHRRWRDDRGRRTARCLSLHRRLLALDRDRVVERAPYRAALEFDRVVDALTGAAAACSLGRYFEFGYRLRVAAGALRRLDALRRSEDDAQP